MWAMPLAHSLGPRSGSQPLPQRGSSAGASQTRRRDGMLLRIIAVLKFLKAASLIALSVGVFRTMHQDIGTRLEHWIRAMHLDPGNRHI